MEGSEEGSQPAGRPQVSLNPFDPDYRVLDPSRPEHAATMKSFPELTPRLAEYMASAEYAEFRRSFQQLTYKLKVSGLRFDIRTLSCSSSSSPIIYDDF
jgi:hypothetical protein